MDERLRQELTELTDMLRTEPILANFRGWLAAQGFDVDTMQLAGLIDNADGAMPEGDGESIGVVVAAGGDVYEFEGSIYDSPGDGRFRWTKVNPRDVFARWPALRLATQ